jgi:3'(2'), 5'-bisphosphate nucleotidase
MRYHSEKQIAIAAVSQAAELCEAVRANRSPNAIEKQDRSPVTIADFAAQAVICQTIAQAFPHDTIVGEEEATLLRQPDQRQLLEQITAQVQRWRPEATPDTVTQWIDWGNGQPQSRYWTLDPIDGTKGFLRGDQYAIALALIEAGEVKVGVIACPALPLNYTDCAQPQPDRGVLFVAVRGEGTWISSLHGEMPHLGQVLRDPTSPHFRLIESVESRHGNRPLQRAVAEAVGLTHPSLQMDSQAKYGAIARGEAVLYLRLPWVHAPDYQENIWDHAAGAIIVEEAGGRVTDMHGTPLNFAIGSKLCCNRGIVVTNGLLHEAVLDGLKGQDAG